MVKSLTKMFLSTPPSRVATMLHGIRAWRQKRFYPRHPRGWRLCHNCHQFTTFLFLSTPPSRVATMDSLETSAVAGLFLSTPPSRVATQLRYSPFQKEQVSIHATLAGGDSNIPLSLSLCLPGFYPRHPRGWRQAAKEAAYRAILFLSTPPSRVATH